MRADLEAFLKSLGSTASEVRVFIALYSFRKYVTVNEIEQRSGLSSKSVRTALKRLKEKGLIKEKREGKKILYRSISNKEIVEKWKKMVEDVMSHLFKRP